MNYFKLLGFPIKNGNFCLPMTAKVGKIFEVYQINLCLFLSQFNRKT